MSTPASAPILIVDDTELARVEVERHLRGLGFAHLDQAVDGKDAIEKLRAAAKQGQPYKLIVCDWNMPEATGLDVLAVCRSEIALQKPGFVMVTAEAGLTSVMEALNQGADDYIIKPIVSEALQKKVGRLLTRKMK